MQIKPGPKRTNEDGTPDKRQRVTEGKKKRTNGVTSKHHNNSCQLPNNAYNYCI